MPKQSLASIAKSVRTAMKKHSPEILTGIGIAGMITTTVMAVKATPKALILLEEKKDELDTDRLEPKDIIKTAWPCYIPAAVVGSISVFCLIGASSTNLRRNAALATAYTLSESTLKEYQEKLHSEAELIQQQIANSNEISERQANYLDKLVESESRVADLADNVKKEADAAQQAVDMLSDHCKDQISGIVDAAKQDMDALAASTKVLTEASHSQMETLAQTAESEMQLLSNTAAQLTKASSEQMSVISEAANNVMQNSKQQIEEAIKATQAQSDALMQATNDFSDFVQQEHKKLVEAVDKEVSGLSNFAGQTTSEIQSATAGMENAAKLLDKNLDDVLDRTFTSFDSSLTDISQHLSGTIADVRDTTEALPHVIRESTKQYEAVLAKLTSQTQSYLDAMEKLTALVEQKAPAVANEEGNRQ